MPGWWFTIESTSSKHLIQQFKSAIRNALASKTEVRAMMRARSLLQRFPVAQWIEDLEKLQSTSISTSHYQQRTSKARALLRLPSGFNTPSLRSPTTSAPNSAPNTAPNSRSASTAGIPCPDESDEPQVETLGPGHSRAMLRSTNFRCLSHTSSAASIRDPETSGLGAGLSELEIIESYDTRLEALPHTNRLRSLPPSNGSSAPGTPMAEDRPLNLSNRRLSLASIVRESNKEFSLQKVDPFFTDSTNEYYENFDKMLNSVSAKSSERELCIEEYLARSEKEWFGRFHRAKLGDSRPGSRAGSWPGTPTGSIFKLPWLGRDDDETSQGNENSQEGSISQEFALGDDYAAPTGLKKFLQKKIGDCQIYSFLLAFVSILQPMR
jgi:alpha-1,3-glucan synthase